MEDNTDAKVPQYASNQTSEPYRFQSVNLKLRGINGWLLLFIIGLGILRPLLGWSQMFGKNYVDLSTFAERFPRTATIIYEERIVISGLIIFSITTAIMLWKVRAPISVTLVKICLLCNIVIGGLDILIVHYYTDMTPQILSAIESKALNGLAASTIVSLVWLLYFFKSERVKATYLSGPYLP